MNRDVKRHLAAMMMRGKFVDQQIEEGGPSRYRNEEASALLWAIESLGGDWPLELEAANAESDARWDQLRRHRAQRQALGGEG